MEAIEELKIGTLLIDMGRIGIITKVIKSGSLQTNSSLINWRVNYEIIYSDGTVTVIGNDSLYRMMQAEIITLL